MLELVEKHVAGVELAEQRALADNKARFVMSMPTFTS